MDEWNFWRMERGEKSWFNFANARVVEEKREEAVREREKKNLFIAMERNINGGEERTFSVETERKWDRFARCANLSDNVTSDKMEHAKFGS